VMSRRALAVGAAIACLCVTLSPATGSAAPLPASQAIRIQTRVVSLVYLRHWLRVAMRGIAASGGVTAVEAQTIDTCAVRMTQLPAQVRPGDPVRALCLRRYRVAIREAVAFLVNAVWLELEARDRGIYVSLAEVRQTFERQRRISFPSIARYRAFLRDTGETQADLMKRVRLDLLSQRLRTSIPSEELGAFVEGFAAKWKPQTTCAAPYFSASDCGRRG
jgi:foldase protein PrsA